jgi:small acid-soluble spore protein D (minor alpha/beta-type SASP)
LNLSKNNNRVQEKSLQGSYLAGSINIDLKNSGDLILMSKNKVNVPEAKAALDKFKMEAANEVGVTLKQGYNGDITSKQAGSVGGQMVKKMVEAYENNLKTNG